MGDMLANKDELGYVPRVSENDLERNISELQSRLDALLAHDGVGERAQALVLEVLLRNRRNIMELLRSGRFI